MLYFFIGGSKPQLNDTVNYSTKLPAWGNTIPRALTLSLSFLVTPKHSEPRMNTHFYCHVCVVKESNITPLFEIMCFSLSIMPLKAQCYLQFYSYGAKWIILHAT